MGDREQPDQQEAHGKAHDVLGEIIRSSATYHAATPVLRDEIAGALRRASPQSAPVRTTWRPWLQIGLGFAGGALATWLVFVLPIRADPAGDIGSEVVAAHARSLMAAHATDVAASDQHTVKPWLSARLDFSPPVPDLGGEGFPLIGGRLDYLAERSVAALVYQRHQHVINVFVWPVGAAAGATASNTARKGFNTLAWNEGGMQFWVISDLGAGELNAFAQRMRARVAEGGSASGGKNPV